MANPFDQFDLDSSESGNPFDQFDAQEKKESGDFIRGAGEAFQQVPQLGYGLIAGAGALAEKAVGEGGIATGIKKAGVEGYQRWGEKVAEGSKESDSWTTSYNRAKEGDFGSLVDWFQHGLGYAAGQGVQILATAGLGSLAAKGAGVGAMEMAKGMVAKEAARVAATKEGAAMSADAVAKLATANVATKIGQNTAMAATAFGMEGGEIYGDLVSQAEKDGRELTGAELGKAFVATTGAGLLEFAGDKIGLDLMLGKGIAGIGGVGGRMARAATGGATGLISEGATEYGQTLTEEWGKGKDPFSEESMRNATDAAALGALGGTAMGGVGGALSGKQPATPDDIIAAPDVDTAIQNFSDSLDGADLLEESNAGPVAQREFGTLSQGKTGFGQVNELADFVAQERADIDERRAAAIAQQQASNSLRLSSDIETTDARVAGAADAQTRQNRLAALDSIYANPDERTPGMTFLAHLGANHPNNPLPTPEEKRILAQRENAYQAFKTMPNDDGVSTADLGVPEKAAPVATERSAEQKIAQVDEYLANGYRPAAGGKKLVNGKGKALFLNVAQRDYLKSLPQAATGTAATSPEVEQPAAPIQSNEFTNSLSRTASWVIRNKESGEVVMETFDKAKVDALNTSKYEAVPIGDYLAGLNNREKTNGTDIPATAANAAPDLRGAIPAASEVRAPARDGGTVATDSGRTATVDDQLAAGATQRAGDAAGAYARVPDGTGGSAVAPEFGTNSAGKITLRGVPMEQIKAVRDKMGAKGWIIGKDSAVFPGSAKLAELKQAFGVQEAKPLPKPKKPQRASSDLLQRIKQLGGIDATAALDITGENRAPGGWKFAFRKGGTSLDDLATMLADEGFQIDTSDVDGGVQQLRDMIRAHIGGERNFKASSIEAQAESEAHSAVMNDLVRRAEELGINWRNLTEAQLDDAVYLAEDELRMAEIAERESLEEEAAEIGALSDMIEDGQEIPFGDEVRTDDAALAAFLGEQHGENDQRGRGNTDARAGEQAQAGTERGARTGGAAQGGEGFSLESHTSAEVARRESAQREAERSQRDEEEQAKKVQAEKDQAEIDARTAARAANPDNFQFGESSKQAAAPVGDLFNHPANPETSSAQAGNVKQGRGEYGSSLSKEERKSVLKTLVDVYRKNGVPKEIKGIDQNGNEYFGYMHMPEYFEKSDITGAMVRYYVTLPDGRIAHPTELFADYTQSDIDAALQKQIDADRTQEQNDKTRLDTLRRRTADTLNEANRKFNAENKGRQDYVPAILTDGKQFIRTPEETAERDLALLGEGWSKKPAAESKQSAISSIKSSELDAASKLKAIEALNTGALAPEDVRDVVGKTATIEDFGEKILGARKEYAAAYKDKMDAAKGMDIIAQPLSKSWPEPDYQKLIDAGADPLVVGVVRSMRDEIPNKPGKSYRQRTWAAQVESLRDTADRMLNDPEFADKFMGEMKAVKHLKLEYAIVGRAELYVLVGHEKSLKGIRVSRGEYAVHNGIPYNPAKVIWEVTREAKATIFGNMPTVLGAGATREEAISAFQQAYSRLDTTKAKDSKTKFELYADRYAKAGDKGQYFIGKKVGRNVLHIKDGFDTVKEARAYMADNNEELTAILEQKKAIPNERYDINQPRVGQDMRNGQDVTPQMFSEAFGFRGVQFGNYVEGARRQKDLNDAYDALMDLAAVLDIPPKALSLNGELGLAFGARGTGGKNPHSAHYEPGQVVINLTKGSGAGSLAHEWWHSLDSYFSRVAGKKEGFATDRLDVSLAARGAAYQFKDDGIRKEMIDAFGAVVKAINGTAIKQRSASLDARRTKEYWGTGIEMSARAFERYVIAKLHDNGFANDYLANVVSEEYWNAAETLGVGEGGSYPYPTEAELPAIRAGFDHFFQTIEAKETDNGVALASRAQSAKSGTAQTDTPEFKAWFGDSKVVDADGRPLPVFHGSAENISVFDSSNSNTGAFFFSPNPSYAASHAAQIKGLDSGYLNPSFLSLQNPKTISPSEEEFSVPIYEREQVAQAKAEGHDGLIIVGEKNTFYAAFESTQIKSYNNRGAFDPSNPDIRASRSARNSGQTVAAVKQATQALRNRWLGFRKIEIVQSDSDLPQEFTERVLRSGGELTGSEGWFDPKTKTVYLVADNLASPERAVWVSIHETVGHGGVRMLGKPVADALDFAGKNGFVQKLSKAIAADRGETFNAKTHTDEALAELAAATITENVDAILNRYGVKVPMLMRKSFAGQIARVIEAVRSFLAKVLGREFDAVSDAEVYGMLTAMREAVEGKAQTDARADGAYALASSAKTNGERFARLVVEEFVAENDAAFRFPVSSAKTLEGVMRDVMPEAEYHGEHTRTDEREETGADHRFVFTSGYGKKFYVYTTDGGKVWIDVSRFDPNERGQAVYAAVANYAYNANKKFVGDPVGVSRDAVIRRTSNMLSSALRFGTTRHLEASKEQISGDVNNGIEPLDWTGSDIDKVEALIHTFISTTQNLFPEVKNVTYDFTKRKFIGRMGKPIDREGLQRLGSESDGRKSRAGETTIRRVAFLQSLVSSKGSERSGILEQALTWLNQANTSEADLDGLFSSKAPSSQSRSPTTTKQGNIPLQGGQTGNSASWDSPEASKLDNIIYTLQDKHIDMKRVVEAIKEAGGNLVEKFNPYLAEELFHGRAAKRTQDFVNTELKPLLSDMRLRGIDVQELDQYLHARHAKEANALIAERDPDMPDGGSGMTNAEAYEYLAGLDEAKRKRLEAAAAKVDAIIAKTRELYVSYGLISRDQADSWAEMFQHYVPLMREDNDGGMGIGQGFSIKGKEVKHRTGSTAKVVDILANIALQREKAITRGEKNRVAVALAGLVKLNPNPDFWTFGKSPVERVLNENTGMVEERIDPTFKSKPNVVVAKIKDSKGQVHERAVIFNEHDDRAVRMVEAFKNLDATQLGGVMGVSAMITRYFASINTQYNPIFGIVNIVRDVQGMALNLGSTPIAQHRADVIKLIPSAVKGIYQDSRAEREGHAAGSKWAQMWEELQDEGGMTGYRELYRTSADRAKSIEKELNPYRWHNNALGKVFTANGTLKVPLKIAQNRAGWLFDWLSDYNQTLEGATRLATYKVARDNGMTRQQAASLAKNITVNFNRKGQIGQQAGAMYAFFNAAMQGSARIAQTMLTIEDGKIGLTKTGKAVVYGGITLGALQALMLAAAGFDDDEPPEFVRERALILPIGNKKYLTLPMPLGFHVFPNLGRIPTEWALNGFKDTPERIIHLLGTTIEAFNPLGSAGMSLQTIMPTALDPFTALAENKDWTGKPIYKEDFSSMKPTPGFDRNKDTATAWSKGIAEALNYLSGGTDYVPGAISPTADQIDYLIAQATGGVGREVSKAFQAGGTALTGEELPPHKMPLLGRFYGDSGAQSSQGNAYYANLKRINEVEAEIKGRRENHEPVEEYKQDNPEWRLIGRAKYADKVISRLRKQKSELIEQDAPREKIKAIENRITVEMQRLNEAARRLEEKEAA